VISETFGAASRTLIDEARSHPVAFKAKSTPGGEQKVRAARAFLSVVGWVAILAGLGNAAPVAAKELTFLSTQLRPMEEAQRTRTEILKYSPVPADFVPEEPQQLVIHLQADMKSGSPTISLIGALHGELAPLVPLGALSPLDEMVETLTQEGVPAGMVTLAHRGTDHLQYVPWMQATYIMAASKQALQYLPAGAKLDTLTYDQLGQWAANAEKVTGWRVLGFPAGPTGLMNRFFEGYLLPSFTGGVVTTFVSPDAEKMWADFKSIWQHVNPDSTSYNFMQEPLLAGDVMIAWDHVARLQDAFRKHPDDFVAFPAPAGPKGRSFMPVVVGLAIPKTAPDAAGARQVIDYLLKPATQVTVLRVSSFYSVVNAALLGDLDPDRTAEMAAVQAQQSAPDAHPALLPVGLGSHSGEFDRIFTDAFQRIVLRGQDIHQVLELEGRQMQHVLDEVRAPCWSPDPPSQGTCQVK
jgi:multiple sugar transport system substrate-binding protein